MDEKHALFKLKHLSNLEDRDGLVLQEAVLLSLKPIDETINKLSREKLHCDSVGLRALCFEDPSDLDALRAALYDLEKLLDAHVLRNVGDHAVSALYAVVQDELPCRHLHLWVSCKLENRNYPGKTATLGLWAACCAPLCVSVNFFAIFALFKH